MGITTQKDYDKIICKAEEIIATEIKNPKRFFEPIYKKHKKTSPAGLAPIIYPVR